MELATYLHNKILISWVNHHPQIMKTIEAKIKKASSQMSIMKYFFSSKDFNSQVKYWAYLVGPLTCLLWGCKSWSVMGKKSYSFQREHQYIK